ncbi:hypothetical protein AVEN_94104-1 [Araneus ventricosus]|uniref:Uncharacterized protein n=1 Tax=Araneus ventricosus TaxID=182803 RepID=A0A4Y2MRG0_ARAVE|nr:hypothetical protein AVEN_94104-1 [Araneus ventricosus]
MPRHHHVTRRYRRGFFSAPSSEIVTVVSLFENGAFQRQAELRDSGLAYLEKGHYVYQKSSTCHCHMDDRRRSFLSYLHGQIRLTPATRRVVKMNFPFFRDESRMRALVRFSIGPDRGSEPRR